MEKREHIRESGLALITFTIAITMIFALVIILVMTLVSYSAYDESEPINNDEIILQSNKHE